MISAESGGHYHPPGTDMGAQRAHIHSDQLRCVFKTAWAPLASTKAETMNRISPAPAAASFSHMIVVPIDTGFVLLWFSAVRKNKTGSYFLFFTLVFN
jgi:hypothetical protein